MLTLQLVKHHVLNSVNNNSEIKNYCPLKCFYNLCYDLNQLRVSYIIDRRQIVSCQHNLHDKKKRLLDQDNPQATGS